MDDRYESNLKSNDMLKQGKRTVMNSEWDKYDGTGKKPKSVDAYMEELNEKYAVCFKITEREN